MGRTQNERREKRLRYQWTVLFTAGSNNTVSEGLMVDVSSGGLAFRCPVGENCPEVGQQVVTHFSIPEDQLYDPSSMNSFTRAGRALRVDAINPFLRQVAIEFDEPLPLKPAAHLEHSGSE
ncbi:MAG: PilZ domain-containing protein [Phycisphaerales bacterium]|nr:MAG: PilZ domain-containing protein [Phycisphaerales bacterium]